MIGNLEAARAFLDQYAAAVSAVVEAVAPAVVRVQREHHGRGGWRMGRARTNYGSGAIINAEKGLILTSYHVVSGTQEVQIHLASGKQVSGKRIGKDPDNDLALVKIDPAGLNLTALPFGDSAALKPGSVVIALGNPQDSGVVATSGIVSALAQSLRGPSGQVMDGLIQTDALFNPGMSGGPLVNTQGQIVGINTASMTEAQGINLAVSSATAQKIVPDLEQFGVIQRPQLGIAGERQRLYEGLTAHHNLSQTHGVYVHEVVENSSAARAGIQAGDIIIGADGETVSGLDSLHRVLLRHKFGDELSVRLIRKLDILEVTVSLTGEGQNQT
ncbi:MAG: trypsin-like peptidase domain-containing protein [Anaerolineae bacterium]|nr:trypsin-like peptidase domain-containing protein [Anaerolineae bacterium]